MGVILHSLRHRDGFARSMVDGRKVAAPDEGISTARPVAGLALMAAVAMLGVYMVRNLDMASGTLQAFGMTLRLGESEGAGGHGDADESGEDRDDD